MAASTPITGPIELPELPVSHEDFISYLNKNPNTPVSDLLAPFKTFENTLRKAYAQQPDHGALENHSINTVPLFSGHEDKLRIRARSLEDEAENERYIMPLEPSGRKPNGAPAVVESLRGFKKNFNLFSESSLVDMDWSNVVAAGSSVVTALLPVPDKYSTSKRALREYYHEKLAPASDVDLFIYGLNEEEAIKKLKQIEAKIRDSILQETTTIRTKNAITIASQYPTRHVQILLRLYKSVSEILTGFDVDCSCFAYDGTQVFGSPRAITAFMTQVNTVDLSRRSPSYENRLSKYSHRGFEVYWPLLERSRVDPTIFERSFARTVGLFRLLVLEKLPKPNDCDEYLEQRRAERGRPPINIYHRIRYQLPGNVKDQQLNDVADWVEDEKVSNYHTFQVPYGPKYHAKKIEKLLYTKDLLLNAEWNQDEERKVNLHCHPCFFGYVDDISMDCCGQCPVPITDEEEDVAAEKRGIYVYGDLQFINDDPGRQAIGSFNPLTEDDWTEMAYVGNTARLCQAIVDGDLQHVQDWCRQADVGIIDRRDHTGRTSLHLAAMASTPEVVQCLIDHGARIVAQLVNGFTALHIAACRGNTQMVKAILERSEANEEEEAERADLKKAALKSLLYDEEDDKGKDSKVNNASDTDEDDGTNYDDDDESDESHTMTEGLFVKVRPVNSEEGQTMLDDKHRDELNVYDVNILAWDSPVSPLHLAILGGHTDVIETLCSIYGADVLLPVKILDAYSRGPRAAILTLILAHFQAAWEGDSAKVKSMTLAPWGLEPQCLPLKITTRDSNGFSPFSIAVFRGYLQLAKIIADIAQAQYQPKEDVRKRFNFRPFDSEDTDGSDYDSEVNIDCELVDDDFTIENVGAVANVVKSNITPLQMILSSFPVWRLLQDSIEQAERTVVLQHTEAGVLHSYGSQKPWNIFEHHWKQRHGHRGTLLRYALWKNDNKLAEFFLQLGAEFSSSQYESDTSSHLFRVDFDDFRYAIQKGRTVILAEIIKTTGAGIPLDKMVKESGIEVQEKLENYQGLSIHGKKRKDWAQAGRQVHQERLGPEHPPLLEAAYRGSIDSAEWFLSDAPIRMYRLFVAANQDDIRLKTLSMASGGIDKIISTWLGARRDLAIHCAILSKPEGKRTVELIRYLIEAIPQSIETPSKEGWTPLLLAFSLNRFHAAQVLIEAGANQRRRDKLGRNIMHLAFADINEDLKSQTVEVKKMIELTDRRAVQELSVERCTVDPGALTPLGRWLYCLQRRFDSDLSAKRDVLELILGLSDGADLEMMDGSGQLPLHVAVKASYHKLVSCIIERNPALLYRENATGQTPLELAETMWLQHHIDNPPVLQGGQYFYRKLIQNQEPEFFLHDRKADDPKVIKTWHVCKEAVKKYSRKRKLVSLNEANEVSKRLAKKQRKENDREDKNQDGEEKAIEFKHELLEWYQRASLADNSPG